MADAAAELCSVEGAAFLVGGVRCAAQVGGEHKSERLLRQRGRIRVGWSSSEERDCHEGTVEQSYISLLRGRVSRIFRSMDYDPFRLVAARNLSSRLLLLCYELMIPPNQRFLHACHLVNAGFAVFDQMGLTRIGPWPPCKWLRNGLDYSGSLDSLRILMQSLLFMAPIAYQTLSTMELLNAALVTCFIVFSLRLNVFPISHFPKQKGMLSVTSEQAAQIDAWGPSFSQKGV